MLTSTPNSHGLEALDQESLVKRSYVTPEVDKPAPDAPSPVDAQAFEKMRTDLAVHENRIAALEQAAQPGIVDASGHPLLVKDDNGQAT